MSHDYIASCSKQSLPKIRAFVEDQLQALKVQEGMAHQIVLAVDEACANSIIHHHQCDGSSSIHVRVMREENTLRIELRDTGTPFPIDEYKSRDLNEIIHNRAKGGLGIQLINKIMDKVEVIRDADAFIYRFTKYL